MVGDEADSCDAVEPFVKPELKENCEEVNGSSDTGEVGGRKASKSAEVKTTTCLSLLTLFCPGRQSVNSLWSQVRTAELSSESYDSFLKSNIIFITS